MTNRQIDIQTDWQKVGHSLPENAYKPNSIVLSCLVLSCLVISFFLFSFFFFLHSSFLFPSLLSSSLLILSLLSFRLLFSSLRVLSSLFYFSLAGTGGIEPPTTFVVPPSGVPICFCFLFFFYFILLLLRVYAQSLYYFFICHRLHTLPLHQLRRRQM